MGARRVVFLKVRWVLSTWKSTVFGRFLFLINRIQEVFATLGSFLNCFLEEFLANSIELKGEERFWERF